MLLGCAAAPTLLGYAAAPSQPSKQGLLVPQPVVSAP